MYAFIGEKGAVIASANQPFVKSSAITTDCGDGDLGKILSFYGAICYSPEKGYQFDSVNEVGMIEGAAADDNTPFYKEIENYFIPIKRGARYIIVDRFYEGGKVLKFILLLKEFRQ